MAATEEANRRENALDALAAEKPSLEVLWEELRKKEQEISAREEFLAKERAQRNEAMAELALLKAQLAQVKRDQETAFQEARDRLISEFEERRKDLEAQQKQEQDRQERLLNELLEIRRKKRAAKHANQVDLRDAIGLKQEEAQ